MKFLRNKELKRMLTVMLFITFTGTAVTYAFPLLATAAAGISCVLLCVVFMLFTMQRYNHLVHLSEYLKRVNSGNYSLELSDNDEGELSILKSEIYKVTVSLKEQNERLSKEKTQLSDSLSDISHQFKTPLTSMSVMTDLLMEGQLDEQRRREFTAQLCTQLERMKWLTEALLKLSRLDADAVCFKWQEVRIREVIDKSCEPLLIPIELKNQSLCVEADDGVLRCDLNWTAEALTNILKNCVEHTPRDGCVSITASTNALFTEIRVRDSGPGIDKADLPFIFDRYYRGKNAAKDSVGIGLAMSRVILNAQGCSIEVRNIRDVGVEFLLRFPVL